MDTTKLIDLEQAIQCGQYDCLKNCCGSGQLMNIWRLMRSLGLDDVSRFEKMLCGCAVSRGNAITSGGSAPSVDCVAKTVEYFCSTKSAMSSIATVLNGLAAAYPELAVALVSISSDLTRWANECTSTGQPGNSAVITTAMSKLCGMDAWIDRSVKNALPDPVASALLGLKHWLTPTGAFLNLCCGNVPVANWPELTPSTPIPTTPSNVTVPSATVPVSNTTPTQTYVPVTVTVPVGSNTPTPYQKRA